MRTAAYARYSSDSQREASLDDQLRNCRVYAARQGWPAPVEFTDAAVSGARSDRPGYVRLLGAAGNFDVILIDDLSRLSRDSIESARTVKRLTFAGVRLIGVSDGVDTGRKSHKADVGLRGLMSELYIDDLAEKTHRGLTGRALQGASAGGLPFGYRVAGVGQRVIDETQAAVVLRIYTDYADGKSPRTIAAALNAESVRPPRGSTWAASAIHGDTRRGIGILANSIYIGRQIWNRSRWVKHPESGRRVRQERPPAEWVTTDHPELAIVTRVLWDAVQARLTGKSIAVPARVGRPARHLLSGLLRCGECGGPMVVIDAHSYGCSISKERGTCSSRIRLRRTTAEAALLAGIRAQLLTEEAFEHLRRRVAAALKSAKPSDAAARKRLEDAERIRRNVAEAIKQGILTPTTRADLIAAEAAAAAARTEIDVIAKSAPAQVLPGLRKLWENAVDALTSPVPRRESVRKALIAFVGESMTVRANENGDLFAEIAASSDAQIFVVAGAGSALYLSEPIRIPLLAGRES